MMMKMTSRKNVKCIVQVSQIGLKEKNKCSRKRQKKKEEKKKPTGKTRSSTIGDMRKGHLRETRSSNGTNKPAHE